MSNSQDTSADRNQERNESDAILDVSKLFGRDFLQKQVLPSIGYKKGTFNHDSQSFQLIFRGVHPRKDQPGGHTAEMDIATGIVDITTGALDSGISIGKGIAKATPTHRQCTVNITNECSNYTLCNPCVHTESGCCFVPLPPIIGPSATGEAMFSKVPNTARGSVGVFTYDLLNNSTRESTEKIAVLYKVPFNLKLKSNAYAVGVFDISTKCNRDLFHDMSKNTNPRFVRGLAKGPSLSYNSNTVTIAATMSDCHTPYIKIQVLDN